MGKASEVTETLRSRTLSENEANTRRSAANSGTANQATTDGRLVTRSFETAAVQEVVSAPTQTWD